MRRNDPAADGQSHPGALRFRGKERVENALGRIARKPNAGIAHRDQ